MTYASELAKWIKASDLDRDFIESWKKDLLQALSSPSRVALVPLPRSYGKPFITGRSELRGLESDNMNLVYETRHVYYNVEDAGDVMVLTNEQWAKVRDLLVRSKVEAIKELRVFTGANLRFAKYVCDDIEKRGRITGTITGSLRMP